MTRTPRPTANVHPCFCGCGEIAVWGGPAGAYYRPGHAPHERAPAPAPPRQAGAPAPPQGDLFGPSMNARWRPARRRLTT